MSVLAGTPGVATGAGLPDNRAYEMVTPPQKNGALIGEVLIGLAPDISEDGSRVIISSIQCFAGARSCTGSRGTEGEQFLFTRTGSGWQVTALAPPATEFEANSAWLVSAETGMELFSMPTAPTLEDDFYVREPSGLFSDVGPATPPDDGPVGLPWSADAMKATANFSHIVYQEPHAWPFDDSEGKSVYEFSGTSQTAPVLVGVTGGAGSDNVISKCGTKLGSLSNGANPGELSADGEMIYFTADACGTEVPAETIYVRIGRRQTVQISGRSQDTCTTAACLSSPPANAVFVGASADGSKAFFTSDQQLTDNASAEAEGSYGNLYEYDFDNRSGENLIDISAGDTSGQGPRVQGVVATSPDGSHIYFVAQGVLTTTANARGEIATNGAYNLYVFERDQSNAPGKLAFIAQLPEADIEQWISDDDLSPANVTPNGRFLVFESHGTLTPDDTRTDGARQIFRYDAQTGRLVRISVGAAGFDSDGNGGVGDATIVPAALGLLHAGPSRSDPTMSHDGSYVFFESPIGLTAHALNDSRINSGQGEPVFAENVYEWHEGNVSLISDGKDTANLGGASSVKLLGSDATGANVFFSTSDALVPQDTDTQLDYYDARVCTGLEPCSSQSLPAPPTSCSGESSCRGPGAEVPTPPGGGSVSLSGAGNVVPPKAVPPHSKRRSKSKSRPKCRRNGRRHRCKKAKTVRKHSRNSKSRGE